MQPEYQQPPNQQYPPQQYPPQQYPPQQYPPQQYPPQEYPPQNYPPQQYPPQNYPPQYPPPGHNQVMPMQPPQQGGQQMVSVQMPAIYFKDALGKLEEVAGVFIKQKFELFEAISGCETENKYVVFGTDKDGDKKKKLVLFKCKEKSSFLARNCLSGECRPFKAKVEHESKIPGAKDGEKCFEYEREFTCTIWCLWRPELKVYLTEGQAKKQYLGKVINPCTFCDKQLDVYNDKDQMVYKIIGSCCQLGFFCKWPCKACQTIQFYVHDAQTGERLTELTKKTAGCVKSAMSDADNFSLVFPKKATKEIRAVMMAGVIMLDFMFFEEGPPKQQGNNASSFGGFF